MFAGTLPLKHITFFFTENLENVKKEKEGKIRPRTALSAILSHASHSISFSFTMYVWYV